MILNEKTLSYDIEPVDYSSKPDFLSSTGMPAIKFVPEDKLVGGAQGQAGPFGCPASCATPYCGTGSARLLSAGLTEIINFLEKKYPEPSLGKTGSGDSPSDTKEACAPAPMPASSCCPCLCQRPGLGRCASAACRAHAVRRPAGPFGLRP